jgi:membrane associated rhomboid family serine protease
MGIYDRDYIRDRDAGRRFRPGGGGAPGLRPPGARRLSAVSWLIIINVAVFFLDALVMPVIDVNYGVYTENQSGNLEKLTQTHVIDDSQTYGPVLGGASGLYAHPAVDPATGQQIGLQIFRSQPLLQGVGHFSTIKALTHIEVWRFISFQFLHASLTHLLLNMLGLYFFGPMVERHLGSRRLFLAFYLTCGIAGGFLYLLLNLLGLGFPNVPGFLVHSPFTMLVGASAGVFGILMACAKIAGNAEMLVFLVIPMKIRHGAYAFVAIAFVNLLMGSSNAGGEAAHLGGAIAGWYFIRNPKHLLDFFDDFLSLVPRPGEKRRAPARRTARSTRRRSCPWGRRGR